MGNPNQRWSLMSRGINTDNYVSPTKTDYTAFSTEEWASMKTSRLDP